jgi:hypothetical protein
MPLIRGGYFKNNVSLRQQFGRWGVRFDRDEASAMKAGHETNSHGSFVIVDGGIINRLRKECVNRHNRCGKTGCGKSIAHDHHLSPHPFVSL